MRAGHNYKRVQERFCISRVPAESSIYSCIKITPSVDLNKLRNLSIVNWSVFSVMICIVLQSSELALFTFEIAGSCFAVRINALRKVVGSLPGALVSSQRECC